MVSRFLGFSKLFLDSYSLQASPIDLQNKDHLIMPDDNDKRYLLNQLVGGGGGLRGEPPRIEGGRGTLQHKLGGGPCFAAFRPSTQKS